MICTTGWHVLPHANQAISQTSQSISHASQSNITCQPVNITCQTRKNPENADWLACDITRQPVKYHMPAGYFDWLDLWLACDITRQPVSHFPGFSNQSLARLIAKIIASARFGFGPARLRFGSGPTGAETCLATSDFRNCQAHGRDLTVPSCVQCLCENLCPHTQFGNNDHQRRGLTGNVKMS